MKAIIFSSLLCFFTGKTVFSQNKLQYEYTGIEYLKLKSELCRGWNTWNTKSVLSHVLLPEAISVDFYLRDNNSGEILQEALMGRRGEGAETILPLAHASDGSYTELEIIWKDIELKIQSCAWGKDICFIVTPLSDNADGEILVSPKEIWWDRDGKAGIDDGQLVFKLPSDTIILYEKSETKVKQESTLNSLVFSAGAEIVLSTEAEPSVSEVKEKIAKAKARHEENINSYGKNREQYRAMQNALAWNIIYEPDEQRELTTVSRLWNDADTIKKYSQRYYSAWINRMNDHKLRFYTALGDHDIGDDAWRDEKKFKAVSLYKKAFSDHLKMPQNGPENMKGTAFWWRNKNVLFISVDVFEEGQSELGFIKLGVTGDQLKWVQAVLDANPDVDHRIVMGHVPVLGPVRQWSSSGLNIKEGRNSDFWQLMKKYEVDAYLCGEVHAVTCTERDGVMQVAHGGLFGYNTRINYLVMKFTKDNIEMEVKEIEMLPHGDFLWQTKNNRPLQNITIPDSIKTTGFSTVGKLTIDKADKKEFKNRKGYFLQEYESSTEKAFPVFRKIDKPELPTELPHINIK